VDWDKEEEEPCVEGTADIDFFRSAYARSISSGLITAAGIACIGMLLITGLDTVGLDIPLPIRIQFHSRQLLFFRSNPPRIRSPKDNVAKVGRRGRGGMEKRKTHWSTIGRGG
jgi:hypothetical protein